MSNSSNNGLKFGQQDTSYKAAGEAAGLRKLCEEFYEQMDTLPEAKGIRAMHDGDLSIMVDKLALFLSMWLGGPREYATKYKLVSMPQAHKSMVINEAERDAWLLCMNRAVAKQPYSDEFKVYLMEQLYIPAEKIRLMALRK